MVIHDGTTRLSGATPLELSSISSVSSSTAECGVYGYTPIEKIRVCTVLDEIKYNNM